jgi:hypothetical protein
MAIYMKKLFSFREELFRITTWHRAIFARGYPQTIFAADAFHHSVRDG